MKQDDIFIFLYKSYYTDKIMQPYKKAVFKQNQKNQTVTKFQRKWNKQTHNRNSNNRKESERERTATEWLSKNKHTQIYSRLYIEQHKILIRKFYH